MNPYAPSLIAMMQASREEVWRGHTRSGTRDLLAHAQYEDDDFIPFIATAPADESTPTPPVVMSYGVTILTKRGLDSCAKNKVNMTRDACASRGSKASITTAPRGEDTSKEEQRGEYSTLERYADNTGDALWASRTDLVPKTIHVLIESGDHINNNISTRRIRVRSADTAITEASSLNTTLKGGHHLGFAAIGSNASPRPVTIAPKRVASTGTTVPSYVTDLQTRIVKDLITAEESSSRAILYSDEALGWKNSICLAHAAQMADLIERRAMRNAEFRLKQMKKESSNAGTKKNTASPTPSPPWGRSAAVRKEEQRKDYEQQEKDSDHDADDDDEKGEMHQAGLIFLEELVASQKFLVDGIARAVKKNEKKKDSAKKNKNRSKEDQQQRQMEGNENDFSKQNKGGGRVRVPEKINQVGSSAAPSPPPPREWPQRERIVLRSRVLPKNNSSSIPKNERVEERLATRVRVGAAAPPYGSYIHETGGALPLLDHHGEAEDRGRNGGAFATTEYTRTNNYNNNNNTNNDDDLLLLSLSAELRNRKSDVLEGHADRSCEALRKLTISTPSRRKKRLVTMTTYGTTNKPLVRSQGKYSSSSSSMNREEEVLVSAPMSGDEGSNTPRTVIAKSRERSRAKINVNEAEEEKEGAAGDYCDAPPLPPQQQQTGPASFQQPYQEHWNSPYSPCPLRVKGLLFLGDKEEKTHSRVHCSVPTTVQCEKGARRRGGDKDDEEVEGQEEHFTLPRRKDDDEKAIVPRVDVATARAVAAAGVEERLVALRFKPMPPPPPPPPLRCAPGKTTSLHSGPLGEIERRAEGSNSIVKGEWTGTTDEREEKGEQEIITNRGQRIIRYLSSNEVETTNSARSNVPVRTYGWIQQSASGLNLRCTDSDKSTRSQKNNMDKREIGTARGGRVDRDAAYTMIPLASPRSRTRRPQTSALGALSARILPNQLLPDNNNKANMLTLLSYCSSPRERVVSSASPATLTVNSARLDTGKGRLPAYVPCSR